MTRRIACTLLLALAAADAARAQSPSPADLIVTAQHIYTVDPDRPVVHAFAVRDGRIVFAGSEREAMALKGPRTRLLALGDRTVIPGITDAHLHLLGRGHGAAGGGPHRHPELRRGHPARGGAGARGHGGRVDQRPGLEPERLARHPVPDARRAEPRGAGQPGRAGRAWTGTPCWPTRGRSRRPASPPSTPDPAGGRIVRNADGSPTGVFVDNAMSLIRRVVPPPSRNETRAAILAAVAEVNRWGLTGVHDRRRRGRDHRSLRGAGARRPVQPPRLRDGGRRQRRHRPRVSARPAERPLRRPALDPRDQAVGRRGPRLARRRAARGLQRRGGEPRVLRHRLRRRSSRRRSRRCGTASSSASTPSATARTGWC